MSFILICAFLGMECVRYPSVRWDFSGERTSPPHCFGGQAPRFVADAWAAGPDALSPRSGLYRGDVRGGALTEEEKKVRALIKALRDRNPNVRLDAIWALGEMGSSAAAAVPALIKALRDRDELVRRNVVWALSQIGSSSVPALIKALRDRNTVVSTYAVIALGQIGSSAVPSLIEALRHRKRSVRLGAVMALADIGHSAAAAVPVLISALRDESETIRWEAAWASSRIGPSAREALTRHLDQERNPEVRETIQAILGQMDYFEQRTPTPYVPAWSYEQVMEILCKGTKDEQRQATQRMVKLLKEEPRRKQEEVMGLVKDVNEVLKLVNEDVNKAEGVRWRLVVALGTVERDEAVVEFLEGIASDRQEAKLVRKNAVLSLGYLGQERSLKVLEGIKNDPGLKSIVESAIHQIELAQGHEIRGVSFDRFSVAGLEALEVLEAASAQAVESAI